MYNFIKTCCTACDICAYLGLWDGLVVHVSEGLQPVEGLEDLGLVVRGHEGQRAIFQLLIPG